MFLVDSFNEQGGCLGDLKEIENPNNQYGYILELKDRIKISKEKELVRFQ